MILLLLHEGLLHVKKEAERLPEGVLRILLIATMIVLAAVNPTIGIVLMCGAVLRYVPVALTRGAQERFLTNEHRSASQSAKDAQAALRVAETRLKDLERDLVIAQRNKKSSGANIDPDHHAVGLHVGAPNWLVESTRRARRMRLHPDQHSATNKQAAHERFVAAEAKFNAIYARRGMRG